LSKKKDGKGGGKGGAPIGIYAAKENDLYLNRD